MTTTLTELPIVDMSLLDGDNAGRARFRRALLEATHEVGFFYLVGHGIDRATRERYLPPCERSSRCRRRPSST